MAEGTAVVQCRHVMCHITSNVMDTWLPASKALLANALRRDLPELSEAVARGCTWGWLPGRS